MKIYIKYAALNKESSKEILYHGTAVKNLSSILSQGLIPDPKERVWSEDPEASSRTISRQSFSGVYLTSNFMTAKSSATRAGNPESGLIIATIVETKTLKVDEDKLAYPLQNALSRINEGLILNEWLTVQTYIECLKGNISSEINKAAQSFVNSFLETGNFPYLSDIKKSKIKEALQDISILLVKGLLERNVAYILSETSGWEKTRYSYDFENNGLNIESVPSVRQAEEKFRSVLEYATKKFLFLSSSVGDFNFTARAVEPIRYSGANRIICIMQYQRPKDYKEASVLKFPYCSDNSVKEKLLNDWSKHIGPNFSVL